MSKPDPRYFFISAMAGDGFATFDDLKAHMRKMDLVPSEFVAVVGHASDLVEEVLLRPRVPLDGTATAPQPKRERTGNAEREALDKEVFAAVRSVAIGDHPISAAAVGEKIGADQATVSQSLQRLKNAKPPLVEKVGGKFWQAVKAPEQGT